MVELAEVLGRHWPAYERESGSAVLPSHRAAVQAILSCRTPERGAAFYSCECGYKRLVYHSCQHRACSRCGQAARVRWRERQKSRLLPVPYFLVTFTVPAELRPLCYAHQSVLYDLFFRESAATLQAVAAQPKFLGAELGFLGVLQTWTRQLLYHPHIHYLVAAAGLTSDQAQWRRTPQARFFLPQKLVARLFRRRLRAALQRQWPEWAAQVPAVAWQKEWVVDIEPAAQAENALDYLSAYVTRTALSQGRILAHDADSITFTYQDRQAQQWKQSRLPAHEFLRRFLQHVLPKGFQRIRTYGWRSPAAKVK